MLRFMQHRDHRDELERNPCRNLPRDLPRELARHQHGVRRRSQGGSFSSRLVVGVVGAAAVMLCGIVAPLEASAENERLANHERWTPSVAFQMGILRHKANGRVVSDIRPPGAVGTPFNGDNLLLDYTFGFSFGLMAPAVLDFAGRPQPFVHLDVMHPLGLEIDLVREGSPDGFKIPDFGILDTTIPANAVGGQGQKTEAEMKSPAVAAGLGLSFSFDAFDQDFRIRPSLQYFYQRVEVSGVLLGAEGQRVVAGGIMIEDFVFTTLARRSNKTLHAIGGGVEFEMDFAEVPGGMLTVGVGLHVYHLQGGRQFGFTATDGTNSATFGATLDPLIYRGGFSTRYRFVGWGNP